MKNSFILMLMMAVAAFSCKDDDEENPAYSFKDQNVAGKIGNATWAYQDGNAEIDGSGDDSMISIDLFLAQDGEEGCNVFLAEGDEVFFTVPAKVGLYLLKLDMNSNDNRTATLYDVEETMNYLASTGAIEILSISDTEVKGRIDARSDDENFVNGNFTLSICPQ